MRKNVEGAVAQGFDLVLVHDHTGSHRPSRVYVTKRPRLGQTIQLSCNGKPVEAYHWPRHAGHQGDDVPASTVFFLEDRYWCIHGWAAANTINPFIETTVVGRSPASL